MWEEERICPSSGAFWVEDALPKENYIGSLAISSYLSCQEINHALASQRREGQASLHVWESKSATFVPPRMKEVGVGDWQTASEVGAASVEVGVRSTQPLRMTRQERSANNTEGKDSKRVSLLLINKIKTIVAHYGPLFQCTL